MKQVILTVAIALFFFGSPILLAQNSLPDLSLEDVNGNVVNVSDYTKDGKITIFSFWATWCSPCKKELNNIADLYEDWQEQFDLEVVAVSIDDQRASARVKPYVDGQGWEYTVLLDKNQDMQRALNFQSVPYTVVVDASGEIIYTHSGYVEGDEYVLEDKLVEWTAEKKDEEQEEKED